MAAEVIHEQSFGALGQALQEAQQRRLQVAPPKRKPMVVLITPKQEVQPVPVEEKLVSAVPASIVEGVQEAVIDCQPDEPQIDAELSEPDSTEEYSSQPQVKSPTPVTSSPEILPEVIKANEPTTLDTDVLIKSWLADFSQRMVVNATERIALTLSNYREVARLAGDNVKLIIALQAATQALGVDINYTMVDVQRKHVGNYTLAPSLLQVHPDHLPLIAAHLMAAIDKAESERKYLRGRCSSQEESLTALRASESTLREAQRTNAELVKGFSTLFNQSIVSNISAWYGTNGGYALEITGPTGQPTFLTLPGLTEKPTPQEVELDMLTVTNNPKSALYWPTVEDAAVLLLRIRRLAKWRQHTINTVRLWVQDCSEQAEAAISSLKAVAKAKRNRLNPYWNDRFTSLKAIYDARQAQEAALPSLQVTRVVKDKEKTKLKPASKPVFAKAKVRGAPNKSKAKASKKVLSVFNRKRKRR